MQGANRRRLIMALLSAGAGMGVLRSLWARPKAANAAPRQPCVAPLVEPDVAMQAMASKATHWIARMHQQGQVILPYPISHLQRKSRIGYSYTCAIAQLLVQAGHWTIAFSDDGLRYARLHPVGQG